MCCTIAAREAGSPRGASSLICPDASRLRLTADLGDARDAGADHQPPEAERQASQHAPIPLLARHHLRGLKTGMHANTPIRRVPASVLVGWSPLCIVEM